MFSSNVVTLRLTNLIFHRELDGASLEDPDQAVASSIPTEARIFNFLCSEVNFKWSKTNKVLNFLTKSIEENTWL